MLQSQPPPPPVHGLPQPPPLPLDVPIFTASLDTRAEFSPEVQARINEANAVVMPVAAIATAVPEKRGRGRPVGSRDTVPRTRKCDLTEFAQNAVVLPPFKMQKEYERPHAGRKFGDAQGVNEKNVHFYWALEITFYDVENALQMFMQGRSGKKHIDFLTDGALRKVEYPPMSGAWWTAAIDLIQYAGLAYSTAADKAKKEVLLGQKADKNGKIEVVLEDPADIIEYDTGENAKVCGPHKSQLGCMFVPLI